MNIYVRSADGSLKSIVEHLLPMVLPHVRDVAIPLVEITPLPQSTTTPMVLLSEGQLQTLRMLASSPHTIETCDLSEVSEAYAQWTQESDDREFERLLDEERREENKWEADTREDLYLGC